MEIKLLLYMSSVFACQLGLKHFRSMFSDNVCFCDYYCCLIFFLQEKINIPYCNISNCYLLYLPHAVILFLPWHRLHPSWYHRCRQHVYPILPKAAWDSIPSNKKYTLFFRTAGWLIFPAFYFTWGKFNNGCAIFTPVCILNNLRALYLFSLITIIK